MRRFINGTFVVINYLLAIFMMYAGVFVAVTEVDTPSENLIWLYESRVALGAHGLVFFMSGATLLYGKVFHNRECIGLGLMAIYLSFLYAGLINWAAEGEFTEGLHSLIASAIVGVLYLRWKYFWFQPRTKETNGYEPYVPRNG